MSEATLICLDNSEYSRNGDYEISRMSQQQDATNFITSIKTQQSPENLIGLMTLAGDRVDLKLTPTTDVGKTLSAMKNIRISGKIDLIRGIKIAQLALKHRLNKNFKQKVICFIGSPLDEQITIKELEKLGKSLKKNNVAIDVISFGEITTNHDRLEKLIDAVNNNSNSNLIEVDYKKNLTDVIMTSPIVLSEGSNIYQDPNNMNSSGFELGVDPSADPELYMALRMSMEEERLRQERLNNSTQTEAQENVQIGDTSQAINNNINNKEQSVSNEHFGTDQISNFDNNIPSIKDINEMEIDEELRQALLLSLTDFKGNNDKQVNPSEGGSTSSAQVTSQDKTEGNNQPSYLYDILNNIPGVDINDPRIQSALNDLQTPQQDKKDGKDNKEDKSE